MIALFDVQIWYDDVNHPSITAIQEEYMRLQKAEYIFMHMLRGRSRGVQHALLIIDFTMLACEVWNAEPVVLDVGGDHSLLRDECTNMSDRLMRWPESLMHQRRSTRSHNKRDGGVVSHYNGGQKNFELGQINQSLDCLQT